MPVNGTRVSVLYAYAMPGPVQTFSAKAAAAAEDVALTSLRDHRRFRQRHTWMIVFSIFGW